MKRVTSLLIVTLMVLLPFQSFTQSTSAHVGASAGAAVGRGRIETQAVRFDNWVTITARHADGTAFATRRVHNLVTNAGFDLISDNVSKTTQPAACNYIAVTNTAITPGATDTTLSGEIDNTNGLGRAQGTYAHSAGTKTYTVTKVFTAGGTVASQATGLFNAAIGGGGTMCYEATYTQVTVNSGDTLTVTWTVTLS